MDTLRLAALKVSYPTPLGCTDAVDDISLEVNSGVCTGIVGESGSGKTQMLLAATGLLPAKARVSGTVEYNGFALAKGDEKAWAGVRGRRIAAVFQDPMTCFTPHLRIGSQLCEVLSYLHGVEGAEARARAVRMLDAVKVTAAAQRLRQYPHELSGGTLQRVLIAMALLGEPRILFADEPTASLDASTRAGILGLLDEIRRTANIGVVLISHDIQAVQAVADRVVVMYAGRIVEQGPAAGVLGQPAHPYTHGLLSGTPLAGVPRRSRLAAIPGELAVGVPAAVGCAFAPRCTRSEARCSLERPQLRRVAAEAESACHLSREPAHSLQNGRS